MTVLFNFRVRTIPGHFLHLILRYHNVYAQISRGLPTDIACGSRSAYNAEQQNRTITAYRMEVES